MTIIKINGIPHVTESQSHRQENWMGNDFIEVPDTLEAIALACDGWCNLEISDGKLVGITPVDRPAPPDPGPSAYEIMRADLDYTMIILGVE